MRYTQMPTTQQNSFMTDILQHMSHQAELKKLSTQLANRLIREEQIQPMGDLHYFLEREKACSNHMAVRSWVTDIIGEIDTDDIENTYVIIRDKFLNLVQVYG